MIEIDKDQLYPIIFEPVYKEVMWGGGNLAAVMGRQLPKTEEPIGEAWEICDRPEIESVVSNGPLAGPGIKELVSHFGKTSSATPQGRTLPPHGQDHRRR
jgi:mannose-6-phosphate isomerase